MYDANRGESIGMMELMAQESESKIDLMNFDYKVQFLKSEITLIKQHALKTYAKMGEDKTGDAVSGLYQSSHHLQ